MNPFEMVVLICAIIAGGSVLKARYQSREHGAGQSMPDPDAERLRDEVRALKERVAVLERIATENDRGHQLDREIERLRDRP